MRVPLDKSEVAVKSKVVLGGAQAPPGLPERLRTKTLEISRWITHRWWIFYRRSFHQPSIRP